MYKLILRYTVSWLLVAGILLASFVRVPETPMEDVPFADKWVHILMYFLLSTSLWIEYLRSHTRSITASSASGPSCCPCS